MVLMKPGLSNKSAKIAIHQLKLAPFGTGYFLAKSSLSSFPICIKSPPLLTDQRLIQPAPKTLTASPLPPKRS